MFDSSIQRQKPFKFTIGVSEIISGLDEGIALMKIGEKAYITCEADYAYGK